MSTAQQVKQFHVFGFMILPRLLSEEELAALNRSFETAMAGAPRYDYFGDRGTRMCWPFEETDAWSAQLATHPPVLAALQQIWQTAPIFMGSDAWVNCDDVPWHSDTLGAATAEIEGPLKVAHYLDPMTAGQGALQVIAGTQQRAYSEALFKQFGHVERGRLRLRVSSADIPGVVSVETQPGDVVVFNTNMWHCAPRRGDGRPRRAVFYSYVPDLADDPFGRAYLRQLLEANIKQRCGEVYGPTTRETGGEAIADMARRVEALGVQTGC